MLRSIGLVAALSLASPAFAGETDWLADLLPAWFDQDPPASAAEPSSPPEAIPSASGDRDSNSNLARQAQNPVANLISLPFQNNINFGVGPDNDIQNVLNIQPVIPFHLSEDLNLITRTILPVIYQPKPLPDDDYEFGLGDIVFSMFLSPAKASKFIWGAGPVFLFPSATSDSLGSGKWGAGPTVVGLYMDGPWVVGALVNNIWSFAGESDRASVNSMTLQPFVNYNLHDGWYLTSSPIITANWQADDDDRWIVPLGGGFGKIFHIGDQPINASVQAYGNVVTPDNGPDWTLRVQFQLLFPE
ncbi:MAG: hypothetical protein KF745_12800 [Phycisphaeraceae bacterium]|nr:hypothetical protein [Phycisphaeraceae bacterium]